MSEISRSTAVSADSARKFSSEGDALLFPGNTFVCHLERESELFAVEERIIRDVARRRFAPEFSLLPLNSLHMTVFEGVIENHRGTDLWPGQLSSDMALEDVTLALWAAVREADFVEHRRLTLRVTGVRDLRRSLTVALEPVDQESSDRLRILRAQISRVTGIVPADPESYRFHSSLGYRLRPARPGDEQELDEVQALYGQWLAEDSPTVTVGPCEFNIFRDMLAFPVLHYLG